MIRMFVACALGAGILGTLHAEFLHPLLEQQGWTGDPKFLAVYSAVAAATLGALWGWVARMVFVKAKAR
jgi:hypothetical protein